MLHIWQLWENQSVFYVEGDVVLKFTLPYQEPKESLIKDTAPMALGTPQVLVDSPRHFHLRKRQNGRSLLQSFLSSHTLRPLARSAGVKAVLSFQIVCTKPFKWSRRKLTDKVIVMCNNTSCVMKCNMYLTTKMYNHSLKNTMQHITNESRPIFFSSIFMWAKNNLLLTCGQNLPKIGTKFAYLTLFSVQQEDRGQSNRIAKRPHIHYNFGDNFLYTHKQIILLFGWIILDITQIYKRLWFVPWYEQYFHDAGFPVAYPSWESDPIDIFESSPNSDLRSSEI